MKKTPLLAAALGAAALVAGLAGCTGSASVSTNGDKTPQPKSSSSAAPNATVTTQDKLQGEQKNPTGACIDGQAIINATDKRVSFPKGCDTVSILGTGATIELGAVKHLVIENDKNTITAASIQQIDSIGHDNTVTYGGDADAKTTDQGTGNTITRK